MKAIDCRPEARQAAAAGVPPADVHTPADRYQELFIAVQSGGIFDDCKAFVDCAPQDEPAAILAAYRVQCGRPGFDLNAFVHQHFAPPCIDRSAYVCTPGVPLVQHIDALWPVLPKDSCGNFTQGDVLLQDCHDTLALSEGRHIACVGVSDLVVVETADAILVAHKD